MQNQQEMDRDGDPGPGPSSVLQAALPASRTSLLPRKWQRLQSQLDGKEYPLPSSGANITLADLIKQTEDRLKQEAAEDVIDTDIDEPYAADRTVPGWVGTPDPTKYSPGTTYLSPEELQQEIAAGNVVASQDWRKAVAELEPWQAKALQEIAAADYTRSRVHFNFQPGEVNEEGGRVSFWDAYNYVYNNPELAALAASRRGIVDAQAGEDGQWQPGNQLLSGFVSIPGNEHAMAMTQEQASGLPWTSVATGYMWGQRPIRWLKGWGGQLDFMYHVFVHDEAAQKVLGPQYANRDDSDVLNDRQYWRDVLKSGPQLGMTFMMAAARDVPIKDAAKTWTDLLAGRMRTRGASDDQVSAALTNMSAVLDPKRLVMESRLCNSLGTHIREGSAVMLTMYPEGKLLVQAMSPDPVRTREYYLLGAIHKSEPLCDALTSLALGNGPDAPQETPLDEDVVLQAQENVLLAMQGVRPGLTDLEQAQDSMGGNVPMVVRMGTPAPGMFRLPRLGRAVSAPVVLSGIQEQVTLSALQSVFQEAALAADRAHQALGEGVAREEVVATRRAAAQKVLVSGLEKLGVQGLVSQPTALAQTVANSSTGLSALSPALPIQPLHT